MLAPRREKPSLKAKPVAKVAEKAAAKKPAAKKTKKIQKAAKKVPAVKPSPKSVKKSEAATVKQEPSVSSGKKTAKQSKSSKAAPKVAARTTTRSGRKWSLMIYMLVIKFDYSLNIKFYKNIILSNLLDENKFYFI